MNDKKGKETGASYAGDRKTKHYVIYLTSRPSCNKISPEDSICLTKRAQNGLKANKILREITISNLFHPLWSVFKCFNKLHNFSRFCPVLGSSISKCSSDAIYRLNGDEWKHPTMLQASISIWNKPKVFCCCCCCFQHIKIINKLKYIEFTKTN